MGRGHGEHPRQRDPDRARRRRKRGGHRVVVTAPEAASSTEERFAAMLAAHGLRRRDWPTYEELCRDGLHDVVEQVMDSGGAKTWARERGFELRRTLRPPFCGVDGMCEFALSNFVADYETFPSRRAFLAAGEGDLWAYAEACGGIAFWRDYLFGRG